MTHRDRLRGPSGEAGKSPAMQAASSRLSDALRRAAHATGGGLPRVSDGVARASRCPASPQPTRPWTLGLAETLGKPSLWVTISAPWY